MISDDDLPMLLLERFVESYPPGLNSGLDAVYRVALILSVRRRGQTIVEPSEAQWADLLREALGSRSEIEG